ncbi:hypothetical protein NDU88_002451 [Pleurodeles waltl]|uniref:Uncharacterized protein n=1 Tax=Pleurodeles waltl TaxID=8319 RepID=A0AAV7TMM7_PLEWA|nr:hypothetical protein NDU88_002451 [Pleurodeles waltl]
MERRASDRGRWRWVCAECPTQIAGWTLGAADPGGPLVRSREALNPFSKERKGYGGMVAYTLKMSHGLA